MVASYTFPKFRQNVAAVAFGAGIMGTSAAVLCEQAVSADKEGGTPQPDPENEFVDISNLQKWDSNWDGRCLLPAALI